MTTPSREEAPERVWLLDYGQYSTTEQPDSAEYLRADLANREPSEPPRLQNAKRFTGGFMVFALKKGKNLSKRMAGIPLPWVRHETLDIAETEARRLNALNPASTFVVMQEVARVKMLAEGEQQ